MGLSKHSQEWSLFIDLGKTKTLMIFIYFLRLYFKSYVRLKVGQRKLKKNNGRDTWQHPVGCCLISIPRRVTTRDWAGAPWARHTTHDGLQCRPSYSRTEIDSYM